MIGLQKNRHKTPLVHLSVRPKGGGGASDISVLIHSRLISLSLSDNRGFEADTLNIELDDSDGLLALPSRGATLTLGLGYQGEQLIAKGDYVVERVSHSGTPDKISIQATSADLIKATMDRKERSFDKKTIKQIVDTLALELGLKAVVSPAFAQQTIQHIDQTNESGLNLLSRLSEEFDAIATVKSGRLLFIERGKAQTATGKTFDTITINRASGDNHHFEIADGENYSTVAAYWHNLKTGKRERVEEKSQDTGQSDSEQVFVLRRTYASKQSAQRAVKSRLAKFKRQVAKFSLNLADGLPELVAETPVKVVGFKKEIDSALWVVSRVEHNLTKENGLTTRLELELKV